GLREFARRLDLVSGIWERSAPPPSPPGFGSRLATRMGLIPPTLPRRRTTRSLPSPSVVTEPRIPWEAIPAVGHTLDAIADFLDFFRPEPHHAGPPSIFLARRARLEAARPGAA